MKKHTNFYDELEHFPPKWDWFDVACLVVPALFVGWVVVKLIFA